MIVNVNKLVSPSDATKPAGPPAKTDTAVPKGGNDAPVGGNAAPDPSRLDLERSIEELAAFMSDSARGLRFHVDDSSGRTVVTVVNPNSGEVIRQIPSEEFLHLAAALRHSGTVHLLDEQA